MWRGYYTFSEARHDVCEFFLRFDQATGRAAGMGRDDVGRYSIIGLCRGTRLAFSKTYVARSRNTAGVISNGNQGHTVEYRGELASALLASGFRGEWSIQSPQGSYGGQFHLWPVMEGWMGAPASQSGVGGRTFEASECVICYDRAISTRLRPCGHVALCGVCTSCLYPRKCPLCRVNIASIENYALASQAELVESGACAHRTI